MLATNTLTPLSEGAKVLAFNRHLITGCTGMKGSVGSLYVFYLFDILSTRSFHYTYDNFNVQFPNKTPWSGLIRSCMEGLLYKNINHFGKLTNNK